MADEEITIHEDDEGEFDDQLLEMVHQMIEGRNAFFGRTVQLTPHTSRPNMISRYMINELVYLELLNRVFQNHVRTQSRASTVLSVTFPSNFLDNVPVTASNAQITAALEDVETSNTNCAICQDSISSGGAKIRQCGHVFHRSCIANWFGMSVRCPVCRRDIRESDQVTQTPPASTQTSTQQEDQ